MITLTTIQAEVLRKVCEGLKVEYYDDHEDQVLASRITLLDPAESLTFQQVKRYLDEALRGG